jgi:hypothetical protein
VSVLAEALSVIIKRSTLEAKYPGGIEGYRRACPNGTFCADENLTRVGFMVPADVQGWLDHLENAGLVFIVAGMAIEIVVVDQFKGATAPCLWLKGGRSSMGYSAVWLAGTEPGELAHPPGWTPSRSASLTFVSNEDVTDRVLHMTSADGIDVLLDLKSGKEVYVGRVLDIPAAPSITPIVAQATVAPRSVDPRKRLKRIVLLETGAAAAALVAGRILSSEPLWFISIIILWAAYFRHALVLWRSDSESYPRFLNIWPALFSRVRGRKDPSTTPFFPDAALEIVFAPLLGSSVWFVWQWAGWKCGGDVDRYTEIPVSQPWYAGIIQLFVIGYYWWSVRERFRLLRQRGVVHQ